jgi:hypothetical protein
VLLLLRRRAQLYRLLDADPAIRERTSFFAAAALVTRTLMRRPSPFLLGLSEVLEAENAARAAQIRAGRLYASPDVQANTADFIHFEQTIVEAHLLRFRARSPARYRLEIEALNRALLLIATSRWRLLVETPFARAVAATVQALGGVSLDVSQQHCRELLGMNIARRCRPIRPLGGEGEIRTPEALAGLPVFKTGAINRSATSPS